jgi:hypothetical protein
MVSGYYLVEPELGSNASQLDNDTKVRVLNQLIAAIHSICVVPEDAAFRVVAAQYLGQAYPAIGMYPRLEGADRDGVEWSGIARKITEALTRYTDESGLAALVEQSRHETLTWEQVSIAS